MTEPIVYTLKHPIELRAADSGAITETLRELTLRRPKGKQLKAMDRAEGEVGKTLALIGACAGQPPSTMDLLDGEDFTALGEMLEDFFGGLRRTGKTSSEN